MSETTLTEAEARALLDREKERGKKISEGHARRRRKLEEARALLEKAEQEKNRAEALERRKVWEEQQAVILETLRREHPDWDAKTRRERINLSIQKQHELYPSND